MGWWGCRVENLLKGKRESEPQVGVCVRVL